MPRLHSGSRARPSSAALLADGLDLPCAARSAAIRLVSGETARLRTVLLRGDPDGLVRRFEALAP